MFIVLALIILTFTSLSADTSSEQFVVEQSPAKSEKHSKNELKEQIGVALKKTMDDAASLVGSYGQLLASLAPTAKSIKSSHTESSSVLGKSLSEISQLQKRLSTNAERLVENKKQFKNASRKELRAVCEILDAASSTLSTHIAACKVHKTIDSLVPTKCSQWHNDLKSINTRLASNECLK